MTKEPSSKKENFVSVFLEEVSRSSLTIIVLAIFTGFLLGGILAADTTPEIYDAFEVSFGKGISESLKLIWETYSSLLMGSFGNPSKMIAAIASGETKALQAAFKPFLESLVELRQSRAEHHGAHHPSAAVLLWR